MIGKSPRDDSPPDDTRRRYRNLAYEQAVRACKIKFADYCSYEYEYSLPFTPKYRIYSQSLSIHSRYEPPFLLVCCQVLQKVCRLLPYLRILLPVPVYSSCIFRCLQVSRCLVDATGA